MGRWEQVGCCGVWYLNFYQRRCGSLKDPLKQGIWQRGRARRPQLCQHWGADLLLYCQVLVPGWLGVLALTVTGSWQVERGSGLVGVSSNLQKLWHKQNLGCKLLSLEVSVLVWWEKWGVVEFVSLTWRSSLPICLLVRKRARLFVTSMKCFMLYTFSCTILQSTFIVLSCRISTYLDKQIKTQSFKNGV